jgi:hypothetical protein
MLSVDLLNLAFFIVLQIVILLTVITQTGITADCHYAECHYADIFYKLDHCIGTKEIILK